MKKITTLLGASGTLLLTACASAPVDNTPKNPTSVLKAKYSINGLYAPDLHGTQTVYTREDKRRLDNKVEFDSFMMRWANYDISDIFRMDQNLLNTLDHDRETYKECPISGCASQFSVLMDQTDAQEDGEEEYESYEDKGCQVSLKTNDFNVESTGKTRKIAGLDAQEYTVNWTTEFEDSQDKIDKNVVQFVFWTTTPTAEMNEAWKIQRKATDNYLNAVGDNNTLVKLLGKDGYKAISAFSGDIEKTDGEKFNAFTSELAKIEGYPLSIKLEWFQKNEACKEVQQASSGLGNIDFSHGFGGAAESLAGNFLNQQKEKILASWEKDARVRYIYEVASVSQQMLHDSKFDIPYDYKMEDRQ